MPADAKELAVRLRHLRGILKEISRRYAAEREAEIQALLDRLSAKPPAADEIEAACEAVEALSVKPDRGRRKDLRRIEECLDRLERILS